jgi:hypothetical protein
MKTRVEQRGPRTGVYATEPLPAGESVLALRGVAVEAPYRFSLQIAADLHLAPLSEVADDYSAWCFVNHSCRPNCRADFGLMALIALRDIGPGEELSFNYCSCEYDMASPFSCDCGAPNCYKRISGFRHLSDRQKQDLSGLLAPHLLALAAVGV